MELRCGFAIGLIDTLPMGRYITITISK